MKVTKAQLKRAVGYQIMDGREPKMIIDLTREELIVHLMRTIDRMEEVNLLQERLEILIQKWRNE